MNVHLLFLFPISLFKGLMVAILYCFLNQEVSSSQRDVISVKSLQYCTSALECKGL